MDATGDAGTDPEAGDAIGDAGTDPGAGDATGDAGTDPVAGDVTGDAGTDSRAGDVIGDAGTDPDMGGGIADSGAEPGSGDAIGDAGTDPGAGDVPGDAGTKPGMGVMISAADQAPVQVCETSNLTAVRGAPFTSTIGPLSLIQPGASLARLAGKQAHLLHSVNSRVLSVAALQPSAGAISVHIPEPPIQPIHLNGEGGSAITIDSSLCYRWKNISGGGEASGADESDVPQFSSTAVPDDKDCIAEDLFWLQWLRL